MAEFDQTSFNSIHPFLDKVTIALVAGLLREQEHQVTDGADLMKLVEMRSGPFKGSAMLQAHQKETGHHNRSRKKGAVFSAQAGMKPVNAIRGGTVDSDVESSAASSSLTDNHINVAESDVQYIEASMTDNENIPSSDVDQVALVDFSILKGVKLEVPCNTWEQEDSEKYFGVGCELKSTEAEVTRVVKPASHHPTFSLRFPARKATFSGYSLQYPTVFKSCTLTI